LPLNHFFANEALNLKIPQGNSVAGKT